MCESCCHNQIIAKIQHFSEVLDRTALEKESLSIVIDDKQIREELHKEILIYRELSKQYDEIFKNIVCKEFI